MEKICVIDKWYNIKKSLKLDFNIWIVQEISIIIICASNKKIQYLLRNKILHSYVINVWDIGP